MSYLSNFKEWFTLLLKEWKELWGIPLEDIKRQGIKYKIYSLFVYILDIMMI